MICCGVRFHRSVERKLAFSGFGRASQEDAYSKWEIAEVIDMTGFVAAHRQYAAAWREGKLSTPEERVYVPADATLAKRIGI